MEKRQPTAGNYSNLFQNYSSCAFILVILFNFVCNYEKFPAAGGSIRESLSNTRYSASMLVMSTILPQPVVMTGLSGAPNMGPHMELGMP